MSISTSRQLFIHELVQQLLLNNCTMKISTISPRSNQDHIHTMHKRHKDFYPRKTQTREKPSNTFLKKKFKYNTYILALQNSQRTKPQTSQRPCQDNLSKTKVQVRAKTLAPSKSAPPLENQPSSPFYKRQNEEWMSEK